MSTAGTTAHAPVPTEGLTSPDRVPVRRALVSVYDKTGLVELATALDGAGVEILSTGSTAAVIAGAGLPVTPVEEVTGFPECLQGRVKTLHPAVHAGILADRRKPDHMDQLAALGVAPIDLVVVNLYPFTDTVASHAPFDACVEQIDIGGPAMVRAAAKNHPAVAVVTDPDRYTQVARAVEDGGFTLAQRRELAAAAFAHTAAYDAAVATWLAQQVEAGGAAEAAGAVEAANGAPAAPAGMPRYVGAAYHRLATLRYGENPHQRAAVYTTAPAGPTGVAGARQLSGKAMSFNNYTDTDAAVRAAYDHGETTCVAVVKHANPCGIAVSPTGDVAEAHRKAHACDPVSAYGGVIATNATVTAAMARQVKPVFTEVVAAPAYEPEAVEILATKRNLRVLVVEPPAPGGYDVKQISGGAVIQERDLVDAPGDLPSGWRLVAGEPASPDVVADLVFAWRAVRAVRSNAILLARDGATVGVGMGQVNRVDSCRLAVERANTLGSRSTGDAAAAPAKGAVGGAQASEVLTGAPEERARGAVAASDAFFPFADGLQVLLDAGVRAVVQPGGSIRDSEVIAAARAAGVTMYLTGTRHFSH
ncbi:bifunctional phosphoribosylaminoimidazolecarboxamide formyltransferase/IMP cyclohydrolase [Actinomyces sp. HMT897]|uniref:bifunctional phosphoribosylaminoimidazolecarboxamide formyltransferase/IMP cyclohydrolase n=1 Tax=Actinomyces sp. HMT897 TaxID=2789424 RepID=UPI00190CD824|nr:bifunctional phosphoribosylaminoimidazolecarboxamide formyltransferase/IMP cyclohydrolase [Actinomyces sp. HMT897]QQO77636.1 bifunctional phosphoribosylaminoimidazolecarboxamide formyltransferase/IMP cyclohydrolase [Actinomyces sp. HMT897]